MVLGVAQCHQEARLHGARGRGTGSRTESGHYLQVDPTLHCTDRARYLPAGEGPRSSAIWVLGRRRGQQRGHRLWIPTAALHRARSGAHGIGSDGRPSLFNDEGGCTTKLLLLLIGARRARRPEDEENARTRRGSVSDPQNSMRSLPLPSRPLGVAGCCSCEAPVRLALPLLDVNFQTIVDVHSVDWMTTAAAAAAVVVVEVRSLAKKHPSSHGMELCSASMGKVTACSRSGLAVGGMRMRNADSSGQLWRVMVLACNGVSAAHSPLRCVPYRLLELGPWSATAARQPLDRYWDRLY